MGRSRVDSRITAAAERTVYKMLMPSTRRSPAEQAADARAKAAGERVYKDSELVPIGKVARVRRDDACVLELAPSRALTAHLPDVGTNVCLLGRGDSIIDLVHIDATASLMPSSAADCVQWQLTVADATQVAHLSNAKLQGARVYVPYSLLTTAAARDAARALAAELPRAWVTTMVARIM
jgi:hypothetical protein